MKTPKIAGNMKPFNYKVWTRSKLEWFKFGRSVAESVATIAGATKVAAYLGVAGLISDGFDFVNLLKSKLPERDSRLVIPKTVPGLSKDPSDLGWRIGRVIGRIYDAVGIANRAFGRIDKVAATR